MATTFDTASEAQAVAAELNAASALFTPLRVGPLRGEVAAVKQGCLYGLGMRLFSVKPVWSVPTRSSRFPFDAKSRPR